MSQWLIFLVIVPLSCLQLTKIFKVENRWMWNGIALGVVIAPLSYGMLQLTYIPVIGKLLGLLGLIINLTHGSIGYFCLVGSGVLNPDTILNTFQFIMINVVNGVLFSYCYGILGYAMDQKLATSDTHAVTVIGITEA